MARNRNALTSYEAAIAAASLWEDLLRLDAIERYAEQDASFHFDSAVKAYDRLKERMERLIAETNSPEEAVEAPEPPSRAFEEVGFF